MGRYAQTICSCFQFSTKDSLTYGINNNCMREIPKWIKLNNNQSDFSNSMMGIFLCNHDTNRIASELSNNINKLIYSAAFLLTLKGIPYIYYGDEIGVDGVKWYGDEGVRTDITKYNHNFKLFNTYKDLIQIRNNSNALTYGDFIPLWTDNNNAAYFIRKFYNEEIHIIISGEKNVKINLQHGSFLVLYGSNKGNVVDLCENSNFNEGITILKRL
ncbi:MAG: alpha-amylase family glycosyl hydrolase [Clostridioides difficile]|nr:alpha-amylase family glycosyl hydrolase [Clostridioides difficile]